MIKLIISFFFCPNYSNTRKCGFVLDLHMARMRDGKQWRDSCREVILLNFALTNQEILIINISTNVNLCPYFPQWYFKHLTSVH